MRNLATSLGSVAVWTLISTGLTGLTTVSANLAVQSAGGAALLGAWALAVTPLAAVLAIQRAILSQSVLRGACLEDVPYLRTLLIVLYLGASAVATAIIVVLVLPTDLFAVVAITPSALVQDYYRFRQFGVGQPWMSALSDLLWIGIFLGGLLLSALMSEQSLVSVVFSYGAGLTVALVFAACTWPRTSVRLQNFPPIGSLVGESGAIFVLGNLSQFVVGAFLSLEVVGRFRLAMTLMQPVTMAGNFTGSYFLPRLRPEQGNRVIVIAFRAFSVSLVVASAVITTVLLLPSALLVQAGLGELKDVWISGLLLGFGLSVGAFVQIVLVRVRIIYTSSFWLSVRVCSSIMEFMGTVLAGFAFGALGLSSGPLINNTLTLGAIAFRSRTRSRG